MLERPATAEEIERILNRLNSEQERGSCKFSGDEVAELSALFYRIGPEWSDRQAA